MPVTPSPPLSAPSSPAPLVMPFSAISATDLHRVGGKGLSLGLVTQAGLPVPPGFCVTTTAYQQFVATITGFGALLDELQALAADDTAGIRAVAAKVRDTVSASSMNSPIVDTIAEQYALLSGDREHPPVAVRSSATLEDLPDASFAGQHDSFLSVRGLDAVTTKVRACFASLFTDRAVAYRRRQKLRETDAQMCVVVQVMAASDVAGVMFTADPVSGHRGIAVVDASYGLGEAVVSGIVNPDGYRIDKQSGNVLSFELGNKALAIVPDIGGETGGETKTIEVDAEKRAKRALTDEQLRQLNALGQKSEALYATPQDIEWGFEGDMLLMLQSRPITSLYPLPEEKGTNDILRAYVCMGHQQANPAVWSPMAISLIGLLVSMGVTKPGTPSPLVVDIGHRAFFDFTIPLHKFPFRKILPRMLHAMSPAISRRLTAIVDRPDFAKNRSKTHLPHMTLLRLFAPVLRGAFQRAFLIPPERAYRDWQKIIADLKSNLDRELDAAGTLAAQLEVVRDVAWRTFGDVVKPIAAPVLLPGLVAVRVLERLMHGRVPHDTVSTLASGLEGNIVTEMDEAIGDTAEAARPLRDVVAAIGTGDIDAVLAAANAAPQGQPFVQKWQALIGHYGHRGPGEIDVAKKRWREDPRSLLHTLAGILQGEPHAHQRRIEKVREASRQAESIVLAASARGVFGFLRKRAARWLIRRIRGYAPMREHHKYTVILLWGRVRQVLLDAGAAAVSAGWLERVDDVFMLRIDELVGAFSTTSAPQETTWTQVRERVAQRSADHHRFALLPPPAVMMSTGEIPAVVRPGGPLPDGVYEGVGVSNGTVEGIARVLHDPADATLAPGEILVAPFTDAAWTTLFVHVGGVVLEAGGAMSHGSVIAREYGIPAVVGLAGATTKIPDGAHIRVDGEIGQVTLLSVEAAGAPTEMPEREATS